MHSNCPSERFLGISVCGAPSKGGREQPQLWELLFNPVQGILGGRRDGGFAAWALLWPGSPRQKGIQLPSSHPWVWGWVTAPAPRLSPLGSRRRYLRGCVTGLQSTQRAFGMSASVIL